MLNWSCPAAWLEPRVPIGTTLDTFQGNVLVSLVGFMFRDTRVLGVRVPWHHTFEEVNLRFYVKRVMPDGEVRRAVVFVRELVPRHAISIIARLAYNEPYVTVPMGHDIELDPERGGRVAYTWRHRGQAFLMRADVQGAARDWQAGSAAEFITEHYWGYTKRRDGGTAEYPVEHPPWRVWDVPNATFQGDSTALYGADFGRLLQTQPDSAFLALCSEVQVFAGTTL